MTLQVLARRKTRKFIVVRLISSALFGYKIAAIIFASFLALFSIYLLVIIIDPRGGILRKGDDLLLRRGLFYTTVKISDVKEVSKTMVKSGDGEIIQDGSVTVIAVCEGQRTELTATDLLDVDDAIMKLKELAEI